MSVPNIVTSRLLLRSWKESDFEPHIRWEADPRVNEFLPFLNVPRTEEASREQIARFLANPVEKRQEWAKTWLRQETDNPYHGWAVEVPGIADVIGGVWLGGDAMGIADFIPPGMGIHWRFASEYWGKGYG